MIRILLAYSWNNPVNSPVEVGRFYPIIYRVSAPSKRWLALGFLNHQYHLLRPSPAPAPALPALPAALPAAPEEEDDAELSEPQSQITLRLQDISS